MKLRIYLDTSVVSAYVDERVPERKRQTIEFWDSIAEFDVYVSELTVSEIQATHDLNTRERILQLVDTFAVLPVDEEAKRLVSRPISFAAEFGILSCLAY